MEKKQTNNNNIMTNDCDFDCDCDCSDWYGIGSHMDLSLAVITMVIAALAFNLLGCSARSCQISSIHLMST